MIGQTHLNNLIDMPQILIKNSVEPREYLKSKVQVELILLGKEITYYSK